MDLEEFERRLETSLDRTRDAYRTDRALATRAWRDPRYAEALWRTIVREGRTDELLEGSSGLLYFFLSQHQVPSGSPAARFLAEHLDRMGDWGLSLAFSRAPLSDQDLARFGGEPGTPLMGPSDTVAIYRAIARIMRGDGADTVHPTAVDRRRFLRAIKTGPWQKSEESTENARTSLPLLREDWLDFTLHALFDPALVRDARAVLRNVDSALFSVRLAKLRTQYPVASRTATPDLAALDKELRRMRNALEGTVRHLKSLDYRFSSPLGGLWRPLPLVTSGLIKRLESRYGPIPTAVARFWEIVGWLNLCGTSPRWEASGWTERGSKQPIWHTDPLVVLPPWSATHGLDAPGQPLLPELPALLELAPDMTTKANVSGGAIRIECAAGTFDPVLIGSTREETFLEHVRRAIVWCGLPGFEQIPNRPAGFPPKKLWS